MVEALPLPLPHTHCASDLWEAGELQCCWRCPSDGPLKCSLADPAHILTLPWPGRVSELGASGEHWAPLHPIPGSQFLELRIFDSYIHLGDGMGRYSAQERFPAQTQGWRCKEQPVGKESPQSDPGCPGTEPSLAKHKALFMQEFIYLRRRQWERPQGCRQAHSGSPEPQLGDLGKRVHTGCLCFRSESRDPTASQLMESPWDPAGHECVCEGVCA